MQASKPCGFLGQELRDEGAESPRPIPAKFLDSRLHPSGLPEQLRRAGRDGAVHTRSLAWPSMFEVWPGQTSADPLGPAKLVGYQP